MPCARGQRGKELQLDGSGSSYADDVMRQSQKQTCRIVRSSPPANARSGQKWASNARHSNLCRTSSAPTAQTNPENQLRRPAVGWRVLLASLTIMKNKYCNYDLEVLSEGQWIQLVHGCRTGAGLQEMLRKGIQSGEYVGYRFITVHVQNIGYPPANVQGDGSPPQDSNEARK